VTGGVGGGCSCCFTPAYEFWGSIRPGRTSQASDLGSIPIARSIKPVDAVGFTGFYPPNWPTKPSVLDAVGREIRRSSFNWTRALLNDQHGMARRSELTCPVPSSDWLVTAGAFIGQIERHYFRIACEESVKLKPGYAYGQSISLSFRTFYLRFL
jgi:hypothetical protein